MAQSRGTAPERSPSASSASIDVRDPAVQRALVQGIRAGDVGAFETVFRAYRAALARLATRVTESPELGDEVVHEVFLKIWQIRATWDVGVSLTAYLFAMTRNAALSVARRRRLETRWEASLAEPDREDVEIADGAPGPDNVAEARDSEAAMARVVETLPPRTREAFLLKWREQLTYPEIAAAMGTSVKTVEKQLGLAFKVLRRALRPWMP